MRMGLPVKSKSNASFLVKAKVVMLLGLSVCGGEYVADKVFYHLSNMVTYL